MNGHGGARPGAGRKKGSTTLSRPRLQARTRREKAEAELLELKLEQARRALVPRDAAERMLREAGALVRTTLDAAVESGAVALHARHGVPLPDGRALLRDWYEGALRQAASTPAPEAA